MASESWYNEYEEPDDQTELEVTSQEDTVTFLFSNFQYIASALAFSSGPPFRKHFWTNWAYIINLILSLGGNIGLCFLRDNNGLYDWFELDDIDDDFRWKMVVLALVEIMASIVLHFMVLEGPIGGLFRSFYNRNKSSSSSKGGSEKKIEDKPAEQKNLQSPLLSGNTKNYSTGVSTTPFATDSTSSL